MLTLALPIQPEGSGISVHIQEMLVNGKGGVRSSQGISNVIVEGDVNQTIERASQLRALQEDAHCGRTCPDSRTTIAQLSRQKQKIARDLTPAPSGHTRSPTADSDVWIASAGIDYVYLCLTKY